MPNGRSLPRRLSPALAAAVLALVGCQLGTPALAPVSTASLRLVPAAGVGAVTVDLRSLRRAPFGRSVLQAAPAAPAIAQVRLTVRGPEAATATTTVPWSAAAEAGSQEVSLNVQAGPNRLITLEALDVDGRLVAILRGVSPVEAGGARAIKLNANTDAAGRILADLLDGAGRLEREDLTGLAATLRTGDLTDRLQSMVTRLTGYDEAANAYAGVAPALVRDKLIAAELFTQGLPLLDAALLPAALAAPAGVAVKVDVRDGLTSVGAGAQVAIYAPSVAAIATNANGQALFTGVPPGTWDVVVTRDGRTAHGTVSIDDRAARAELGVYFGDAAALDLAVVADPAAGQTLSGLLGAATTPAAAPAAFRLFAAGTGCPDVAARYPDAAPALTSCVTNRGRQLKALLEWHFEGQDGSGQPNKQDNLAVIRAIVADYGYAELPTGAANGVADFLTANATLDAVGDKPWIELTSPVAAQYCANNGFVVVAARRDAQAGHMVTLAPGQMAASPLFCDRYLPLGTGGAQAAGLQVKNAHLRWAWPGNTEMAEVRFFVLNNGKFPASSILQEDADCLGQVHTFTLPPVQRITDFFIEVPDLPNREPLEIKAFFGTISGAIWPDMNVCSPSGEWFGYATERLGQEFAEEDVTNPASSRASYSGWGAPNETYRFENPQPGRWLVELRHDGGESDSTFEVKSNYVLRADAIRLVDWVDEFVYPDEYATDTWYPDPNGGYYVDYTDANFDGVPDELDLNLDGVVDHWDTNMDGVIDWDLDGDGVADPGTSPPPFYPVPQATAPAPYQLNAAPDRSRARRARHRR